MAEDEAAAVGCYEVTTERRLTVRVERAEKPKVRTVREVRRAYVDPETVRSTRVVTAPGDLRTVTMPVTVERVVTAERNSIIRTDVRTETRRVTTTRREITTTVRTTTLEVTATRPVTTITATETAVIATTVLMPTTVTVTVTKRKDGG